MGARRGVFRPHGRDFTAWTGRTYNNNTRARVLLRRMCVKPAALTIHSPPKTSPRPHTATRLSRALPLPHAAPTHARRLRDARPQCAMHSPLPLTTHSPPKTFAHPRTATRPSRALPLPHAAPTHARRLRDAFPTDRTTHSQHSDRPFPSTSAPPRSADARPQAARCIPRRPHNPFPAQRHAASPSVPLRAQKTAPHSACAMPNVSVDRRCGRSFGLVSRALFAAVAGHVACRRGA